MNGDTLEVSLTLFTNALATGCKMASRHYHPPPFTCTIFHPEKTGKGWGRGTLWDGGVGGAGNDDESIIIVADVTQRINQRWAKLQKEMCVKSFVSIFGSIVQKATNGFY